MMNSREGCGYTGAASNLDMIESSWLEMPASMPSWERPGLATLSILSACGQVGESRECRCLFRDMLLESDSRPDNYTFVTILGVCKQSREDLSHGKLLHQLARESSGSLDLLVATALVHMYSECGSLEDTATFGTIQQPDVVSWNAMISALSHYGEEFSTCSSG
ncbi:pentatricopeptide repeat-containing protein At2g29760, chloroplastic-like [Selaginella moellendorffii]|uniref:pentatricopeptide repeat-containing protein At2g29760, chloroplastic-like n=1 Tax=Selaginella moellendorffii TaxID=88036 RepID=UPI000D1C90C4|nr:pentatricopeptide repeat-containing protein At2g29760, chloroplastic-like [Selaginella moellendorffii]|eukprot:XP_024518393.1 pentatricopeptide repeat-containing protein At2g29760, chloroplastic-like [Selaginella moellendorffii]